VQPGGSLWGMGYNGAGQLGDGTITDRHTPIEIVTSNVVAVAAGANHSLFIKSDGSLWAIGWNSSGQLAAGLVRTARPSEDRCEQCDGGRAGYAHSLFIKSNGSLWAMGDNQHGQLGRRHHANRYVPVQIVASNVVSVAGGEDGYHTLFTKTDGSLVGWEPTLPVNSATAPIQTRTFQSRSFPSPLETAASRAETSRAGWLPGTFPKTFVTTSLSMAIPADSAPNSVRPDRSVPFPKTLYDTWIKTIGYRFG